MATPEALAEKLRAIQQRSSERDLYDVIRYTQQSFPKDLVRLLAVVKLYNSRQPFQPELVLGKMVQGRRDWGELRHLLGRKDRTDWNEGGRKAGARLAFLRDLTGFERELIADCRRHRRAREIPGEIERVLMAKKR